MALRCGAGFSPTNTAAVVQLQSLQFSKNNCRLRKFARGRNRAFRAENAHQNAAIRAAQDVIHWDSGFDVFISISLFDGILLKNLVMKIVDYHLPSLSYFEYFA